MMKKLFLVLALVGMFFITNAQVEKTQALFIYNFTRLVEWPVSNSEVFTIGVYGNSLILHELEAFTNGKKAGAQDIVVKKISSAEEATDCQIVFVTSGRTSKMAELLTAISNENVLVVGETEGLVNSGAAINFIMNDNRLSFELNPSNANKYGLKVSNSLENMAYSKS